MTSPNEINYISSVPIRVFVFEDHWMCREALISVLNKEEEIEIVGASEDVDQGIDELTSAKPDIVLMDIRFDKKDLGIAATAVIREKFPTIRVIIFTDFADETNLRAAVDAGASGFLRAGKPTMQAPPMA